MNLVLREDEPSFTGMHFIVENVALACAAVTSAGGDVAAAIETPHGVVADAFDTEGNTFTLRQCCESVSTAHAA
jgi:predicted enzyme related to lactoylglutathione lyase